jgi:hypothetical protein
MIGKHSHIISSLNWNTSFDRKEMASELQERLSNWSKTGMQKQFTDIFDRICPPEQTWRIQSLELDLGAIDYNEMETELSLRLRAQVLEKLIDMVIYATKSGQNNIEILDEVSTQIGMLQNFLLTGLLPWNYKMHDGSVNQMMVYQLGHNKKNIIRMLRDTATSHENVRKRMAWQFREAVISRIIEGLEPNNHSQITEFSDNLVNIQKKESVIQSGMADFKKNLWLWIFNYLLTERGTIYNKVAFMKSSIRQMANHYNIAYDELLNLIQLAVNRIDERTNIKPDFILTLKELTKEKQRSENIMLQEEEATIDYWNALRILFTESSRQKTSSEKAAFNDLVTNLCDENRIKFSDLIASLGSSGELWSSAIADLNNTSLETIFSAMDSSGSAMLLESIYFLIDLAKEAKLNIDPKRMWETGMKFLHAHKSGSFDNKTFLSYCISELGITNSSVTSTEIPSARKSIASLEIFKNLVSVFLDESTRDNPAILSGKLNELLHRLVDQFNARTISPDAFALLQNNFSGKIRQNPAAGLEAFRKYPDHEKLRKALPSILDEYTIQFVLKNSKGEIHSVLSGLRHILKQLKRNKGFEDFSGWFLENIEDAGLEIMIFHSGLNKFQILEYILQEISDRITPAHVANYFTFIDSISGDREFQSVEKAVELSANLKERMRSVKGQSVLEQAQQLMALPNKQDALEKLFRIHNAEREFSEIKKSESGLSKTLLNYLVSDGGHLMEKLLKEYATLLSDELKKKSGAEINSLLRELFWKCALNYSSHFGSSEKIKKLFHASVLFHFDLPPKSKLLKKYKGKYADRGRNEFTSGNGKVLKLPELFGLTVKCLSAGAEEITDEAGRKFQLAELISAALEIKPAELRRIFAATPVSGIGIEVLKKTISFREFSMWIMSDGRGQLNSAMETMRLLSDIVFHLAPGTKADSLIDEYWTKAWQLIRKNSWSDSDMKKLVQDSFVFLAKEMNLSADHILMEMKQRNIRLTPLLQKSLVDCFPAFSILETRETTISGNEKLLDFERKGLVDILTSHLILQKQIPSWAGTCSERDVKDLLNEIVTLHPEKFLIVVKREIIPDSQMRWLSQIISFQKLTGAIRYLNKDKHSQLVILDEFYEALGKINVRGIQNTELQVLLFRKVLKAWTSANWRIISIENIWNELIWELCLKRGVSKNEFLRDIGKAKIFFPPSLQVSLENVLEKNEVPVPAEKNNIIEKQKKKLILQSESVKRSKGGVAVKNAGIVLLNNYIMRLFERLEIVKDRKFVSQEAQLNAVHYLQYIITGLCHTEETLLPLNKVICGLPLSQPVQSGLNISDEQKNIIDGLVRAAISHWPNIGDSSINGFRGNWLVRDGLLVEQEDKWELTVDKRAYDILIYKSPFSFSIIKYHWMDKPIHVSWPY